MSQTYLIAVGGQDEVTGLRSDVTIVKMVPLQEGETAYCDGQLYNTFYPSELGNETVSGIQEHVMVMEEGEPIVCGGILGNYNNGQAEAGARCYEIFRDVQYENWSRRYCIYFHVPMRTNCGKLLYIYIYLEWRDAPFSMLQGRVSAASVKLDDGRYWIIGKTLSRNLKVRKIV